MGLSSKGTSGKMIEKPKQSISVSLDNLPASSFSCAVYDQYLNDPIQVRVCPPIPA